MDPGWIPSFVDELEKIAISHGHMVVPKARSGRRSMSVTTLLRKERDGSLFKGDHPNKRLLSEKKPDSLRDAKRVSVDEIQKESSSEFVEHLEGGLAAGKKPSQFDHKNLMAGRRVEMEHTRSPEIATEIAMDHLTEDPGYYQKLRKMEKSAAALGIAKQADLVDDESERKARMRRRLERMAERKGTTVEALLKAGAAATEQANAVFQEVDPKNPSINPKTTFRRGDVPTRDEIPGRTGAEYRPDVSGSTASRGLAPEGYGGY